MLDLNMDKFLKNRDQVYVKRGGFMKSPQISYYGLSTTRFCTGVPTHF
jgi:hypothetical protein